MENRTHDGEVDLLLGRLKSAAAPLREVLREVHARHAAASEGKVADYIPELAKADPNWFGISVISADGQIIEVGDCDKPFTIQSISKPFVYGMALEDCGLEQVLAKVGVEPTGEAFNSIVLDEASNRPFNPMVNAGAIATADLVAGKDFPERLTRMLAMFSRYCGRPLHLDNSVFLSERITGHRNRAIAHLMLNFGMMSERMAESLELYFQQCSVLVTCRDLAMIGATLANGGVNPVTGERAIAQPLVKYVLSIMHSCGMYDYAGEWAFRVGMPAKSGVGGGIVAVVPGGMGIGVFSPPLDAKGNSVRGVRVCRELFPKRFGACNCFEVVGFTGPSIREQFVPCHFLRRSNSTTAVTVAIQGKFKTSVRNTACCTAMLTTSAGASPNNTIAVLIATTQQIVARASPRPCWRGAERRDMTRATVLPAPQSQRAGLPTTTALQAAAGTASLPKWRPAGLPAGYRAQPYPKSYFV